MREITPNNENNVEGNNKKQRKPLTKQNKVGIVAIVVVLVLVVSFAIFLPFYLKENEESRKNYADRKIEITAFGEVIGTFTLEQLLALDGVEEVEFESMFDPSGNIPVKKTYTGIELKKVCQALGIVLGDARSVTLVSSDGERIYQVSSVLKNNNVFIAYKVNGKPFHEGIDGSGYKRDTEEGGPYVVIDVEKESNSGNGSQYRCKLFTGVIID